MILQTKSFILNIQITEIYVKIFVGIREVFVINFFRPDFYSGTGAANLYMDYGSVADRMEGIAKVFPLFFFLVAALVCLTTMTRQPLSF